MRGGKVGLDLFAFGLALRGIQFGQDCLTLAGDFLHLGNGRFVTGNGVDAISEVGPAPALGGLDGVRRAHLCIARDVFAGCIKGFELGYRQNVIIGALRQSRGGDADEACLCLGRKTYRGNVGVGEIGMGFIANGDGILEIRRCGALHLEAHGETKSAADIVKVIVAGAKHHAAQVGC